MPLELGVQASGGGHKVDFWTLHLVGGDKVDIAAVTPAHTAAELGFSFDIFAPETTDGTLPNTPPVDEAIAKPGIGSTQQISIQAPYTGTFVFAVCESFQGCRSLGEAAPEAGRGDSYSFTATLESGGIPAAEAAKETRAGATIATAPRLKVGAFEAGGGEHIDYWKVHLARGQSLAIKSTTRAHTPAELNYYYDLFAPSVIDGTVGHTPPVAQAQTMPGVGSVQSLAALKAPYTGTFTFAVCEGGPGCEAAAGGAGGTTMLPYTFTTRLGLTAAEIRKQKLAAALKRCARLGRAKRPSCVRVAHRRYG